MLKPIRLGHPFNRGIRDCKRYSIHRLTIVYYNTIDPIKLETGLRPNSAGIPYVLLLRVEAIAFPTFGLLL